MSNYPRLRYKSSLTDAEYRGALILDYLDERGSRILARKLKTGMHSWEHPEFPAALDLLVAEECIRIERVREPGHKGWQKFIVLIARPDKYWPLQEPTKRKRRRRSQTTWFKENIGRIMEEKGYPDYCPDGW